MSNLIQQDKEFVVDIESQEQTHQQGKKYLGRVWSGILNVDNSLTSSSSTTLSKSSGEDEDEDIVALLGNQMVNEKRKKTASNKPPKPPRPPRGPSLDIADQKLVREISELAMVKRARRERAKAQKKAKMAKSATSQSSSPSHTSICAMIVTVLFCIIIFFQGMLSRKGAHASFDGSPESAIVNKGALITVQYYKNPSTSSKDPSSDSPSLVEQVSGSHLERETSRGAG